ncbi:MAG: hypothetical protein ACJARK_002480 [Marinobacter psychrophilus]|jgi:hypothetical protein
MYLYTLVKSFYSQRSQGHAMHPEKPFSQACENNKGPILDALRRVFTTPATVLEIGTGTGQHAVHFATHLPHLYWQTSDHPNHYQLCQPWLIDAGLPNIGDPIALNVSQEPWPVMEFSGVFSANTAHIMAWHEVEAMFAGVGRGLADSAVSENEERGQFCLYGPFKYNGDFTSASNQSFDQHLRSHAAHMGIRNIESLIELAQSHGMVLAQDRTMPANNQLLVWRTTTKPEAL